MPSQYQSFVHAERAGALLSNHSGFGGLSDQNLTSQQNQQMIQRLNSILTQNTVSLEVKCLVNQSVIDKNFEVIIQCLRDLGDKQSSMERSMNDLIERNQRMEKQLQPTRTGTLLSGPISEELIKVQHQQDKGSRQNNSKSSQQRGRRPSQDINSKQPNSLSDDNDIRELVKQLEGQMLKESELSKRNNLENIKDINMILKDFRELKQRVEKLENASKQNQGTNEGGGTEGKQSNMENIRILQNQLHKQSQKIDKLNSEVDKLKNKNNSVLEKLRALEGNPVPPSNTAQTNAANEDSGDSKADSLRKELQKLNKKVSQNQAKQRQDVRDLTTRLENIDVTLQNLKDLENRVVVNEEDIQQLKQRLSILSMNNNNVSFDPNAQKQKLRLEKQLRRLEESNKKDTVNNEEWRRRVEQNIKEHTLNIADIQTRLSEMEGMLSSLQKDNNKFNTSMKELDDTKKVGSRLPSLGQKNLKLKSISREGSAHKNSVDIDKRLQDLRSEIQQWVRQLLDSRGIVNQETSKKKDQLIDGIDLRVHQLKMLLEKKADNEGVKKYLSFLDNKINQIWSIMSEPETEDALIARKGWNCLSCAKKLQKYRGKVGDHINWNNMTTTNYSPPRIGYSQSVFHNTTQNITILTSRPRPYGNQQQTSSKEFPL